MNISTQNVDPEQIARFSKLAHRWWDPQGDLRPLHEINPLRLDYIDARAPLTDRDVLDVGCGGGLLTEAMAWRGAKVTGIDMGEDALLVARMHAAESGLEIDYHQTTPEALSLEMPQHFDIVTCMEMLEHVPDPSSVVHACARLLKPGGQLFFSTINRNPKAFALVILGAEYILRMLPRGTHEYARFIRPVELERWIREAGMVTHDLTGLSYHPLTRSYSLSQDISVNYLLHGSCQ